MIILQNALTNETVIVHCTNATMERTVNSEAITAWRNSEGLVNTEPSGHWSVASNDWFRLLGVIETCFLVQTVSI